MGEGMIQNSYHVGLVWMGKTLRWRVDDTQLECQVFLMRNREHCICNRCQKLYLINEAIVSYFEIVLFDCINLLKIHVSDYGNLEKNSIISFI